MTSLFHQGQPPRSQVASLPESLGLTLTMTEPARNVVDRRPAATAGAVPQLVLAECLAYRRGARRAWRLLQAATTTGHLRGPTDGPRRTRQTGAGALLVRQPWIDELFALGRAVLVGPPGVLRRG